LPAPLADVSSVDTCAPALLGAVINTIRTRNATPACRRRHSGS
jgi:hypothetical protein